MPRTKPQRLTADTVQTWAKIEQSLPTVRKKTSKSGTNPFSTVRKDDEGVLAQLRDPPPAIPDHLQNIDQQLEDISMQQQEEWLAHDDLDEKKREYNKWLLEGKERERQMNAFRDRALAKCKTGEDIFRYASRIEDQEFNEVDPVARRKKGPVLGPASLLEIEARKSFKTDIKQPPIVHFQSLFHGHGGVVEPRGADYPPFSKDPVNLFAPLAPATSGETPIGRDGPYDPQNRLTTGDLKGAAALLDLADANPRGLAFADIDARRPVPKLPVQSYESNVRPDSSTIKPSASTLRLKKLKKEAAAKSFLRAELEAYQKLPEDEKEAAPAKQKIVAAGAVQNEQEVELPGSVEKAAATSGVPDASAQQHEEDSASAPQKRKRAASASIDEAGERPSKRVRTINAVESPQSAPPNQPPVAPEAPEEEARAAESSRPRRSARKRAVTEDLPPSLKRKRTEDTITSSAQQLEKQQNAATTNAGNAEDGAEPVSKKRKETGTVPKPKVAAGARRDRKDMKDGKPRQPASAAPAAPAALAPEQSASGSPTKSDADAPSNSQIEDAAQGLADESAASAAQAGQKRSVQKSKTRRGRPGKVSASAAPRDTAAVGKPQQPKRGPGRPRKVPAAAAPAATDRPRMERADRYRVVRDPENPLRLKLLDRDPSPVREDAPQALITPSPGPQSSEGGLTRSGSTQSPESPPTPAPETASRPRKRNAQDAFQEAAAEGARKALEKPLDGANGRRSKRARTAKQ